MEPWKDSCCSMREASAEVGDQDRRHSTCEQIVCLSLKNFIPDFVAFFVSFIGIFKISCIRRMSFSVTSAKREFAPASHCFITTSRDVFTSTSTN